MSEFESLNAEHQEFERSLKQLRPADPELNVADLMFRAGQDSGRRESRRQLRCWQFSTLATGVCAIAAVVVHWPGSPDTNSLPNNSVAADAGSGTESQAPEVIDENNRIVVERADPVPTVADRKEPGSPPKPAGTQNTPVIGWWYPPTTVSVSTEATYVGLRNRVLRDGINALPRRDVSGGTREREPLTSSPLQLRDAWDNENWNQI